VDEFVETMKQQNPLLNIFYDKDSIPVGGQWLKMISDAIGQSEKFVAILSPDYSQSPVCWDEFQCAKLLEYNTKKSNIQTVYFMKDTALPLIMGIYSYVDCTEKDIEALKKAAKKLIT